MKLIRLQTTIIFLVFALSGEAQVKEVKNAPGSNAAYSNAIGLRAGGTSGLTFKHFMSSGSAIEGILGFWGHGFSVTGVYEIYAPTGAEGLSWYYGGGGHIAVESSNLHDRDDRYYRYRNDGFGVGIDGMLGLEYKIRPIPFAISLDLKPLIEVTNGGNTYWSLDPGLGLKFTF